MWSIKLINSARLIKFIFIFNLFNLIRNERVKVKIYDHRAEHDPVENYGKGPWNYYGYGYGLEYQYEPDGSYERQKGYGFVKAYGRDFCKDQTDKSKCQNHQTSSKNEINNEVNHHYPESDGVLNSNYLKEPNSITNSDASMRTNQVVANSDQVLVRDKFRSDENELKNKLNDQHEIARIYILNKNVDLPDTVRLNSVDDSKLNAPKTDDQHLDKLNFYKNKMLIFDDINSISKDTMSASNNKISNTIPSLNQINYFSLIKHSHQNKPNYDPNRSDNNRIEDRIPINRLIDQLNTKSNGTSSENSPSQNSQLIDLSSRTGNKQPIYLASNHYNNLNDDSDDPEYTEDHHFYSDHYDPFAENLKVPKIVHSAAKQLKKKPHRHHTNHYSSPYDLSDNKNDYRSTNHNDFRNDDRDDYEDTFDSHLLGATNLQPKFIKAIMNKEVTEQESNRPLLNDKRKDVNLNKNLVMNSSETKSANSSPIANSQIVSSIAASLTASIKLSSTESTTKSSIQTNSSNKRKRSYRPVE